MDKATKLETIYDRISDVETRFELYRSELEIKFLRAAARKNANRRKLRAQFNKDVRALEDDLAFLRSVNQGGEFLQDEKVARVEEIGTRTLSNGQPLLTEDEVYNLTIRRGTLTSEERQIINDHIVHTIEMLENLPFPKHLAKVPEYAGGHHEKMDGSGYPLGLTREQLSIPARVMIIADVFEALTATDRPYKTPKKLSEAMRIMGFMKRDNHVDPDLFDLFVNSGVYREYAARYMPKALVDEVDEAALLAVEPKPRPDLNQDSSASARRAG
ncbi:MAG: HD domain-containing phosphohydrolase [Myxococcota bacterium]